jgi:hypothetical protein
MVSASGIGVKASRIAGFAFDRKNRGARRLMMSATSDEAAAMEDAGGPDGSKVFTVACLGQICDQLVELDPFGSSDPIFVGLPVPVPDGVSWGREPS